MITMDDIRAAARARQERSGTLTGVTPEDGRAGYPARASRPSHRRCDEDRNAPARATFKVRGLEVRAKDGSDKLVYEGWASVTDAPYEMWDIFGPYVEKVTPGAFTKTLAQTEPPLDVPLVLQHDALRRIARTTNGSLQLDEDETGLHVLAPELDPKDADVAYIAPKLRSGLIDEMSFKFRITRGSWSPDWMEYHIEEVDIHRGDVAIVAYGANPHTTGSGLRQAPEDYARSLPADQALEVYRALGARLGTPAVVITDEDTALRTL